MVRRSVRVVVVPVCITGGLLLAGRGLVCSEPPPQPPGVCVVQQVNQLQL